MTDEGINRKGKMMKKVYILALSLLLPCAASAMETSVFADENSIYLERNGVGLSISTFKVSQSLGCKNSFSTFCTNEKELFEMLYMIENDKDVEFAIEEAIRSKRLVFVKRGMAEEFRKEEELKRKYRKDKLQKKEESERLKFVMDEIGTEKFAIKDWKNNFSVPKVLLFYNQN